MIKSHKWERVTNNCPMYVLLRDTRMAGLGAGGYYTGLEGPYAVSTGSGPKSTSRDTCLWVSTALY